jgi:UDP-N-acetylglucosamine 2-epimerase
VEEQFKELLDALDKQKDSFFIFTKANADTSGRIINKMIDDYVAKHSQKAIAYTSMGQLRYLSAMKYCTAVVGNSSSGIIEAPSFNKPVINIGDRQKGRIQAKKTINVVSRSKEIEEAFDKIKVISTNDLSYNPYDHGDTSNKILTVIKNTKVKNLAHKSFYNLGINV